MQVITKFLERFVDKRENLIQYIFLYPVKVAFTIKEFREMINLPETCFQIHVDNKESIMERLSGS